MAAKPSQKEKIVRTTAELLRRRGYAATGLAEIIEASGAPKGSLYHYFPGGKDEIAAAALAYAGERVSSTLSALAETAETPGAMVRAYGALLAGWMAQSGFRDGCPITTTLLETAPEKTGLTDAGRDAFEAWFSILERRLVAAGLTEANAHQLSRLTIMALEGALILSRVEKSGEPIMLDADRMAGLIDTESPR